MQKITHSIIVQLMCAALAVVLFVAIAPVAQAQGPDGNCNGGVKFTDQFGKTYCMSQPDSLASVTRQASSPLTSTPPITTAPSPVVCDGDGTTGFRTQVIYAYVTTNRFSIYSDSIKEWASGVDKKMVASAAITGGVRHVRYVTEVINGSCYPKIDVVQLSAATLSGTNSQRFSQMITELQRAPFNYTSSYRDYMVFVDAQLTTENICGISTVQYDDSAGQTNINNVGPNYMQIDDNCWNSGANGPLIPAHELMHNLGGVQMSAPHSDGGYHCTEGYDLMCDYTYNRTSLTHTMCPNVSSLGFYDCDNDDYFNTKPAAGSYLATHWNTANSRFLVYGTQTAVRIDSIMTGKLNGSTFSATDTFASGDTVVTRVHVADTNGNSLSGASVNFTINQPNNTPQCTFTAVLTDSNGNAQGTCIIPPTAPTGSWTGRISTFTRASYPADSNDSVTQKTFNVGYAPTAVTLSSFTAQVNPTTADNSITSILVVAIIFSIVITLGTRLVLAPAR